MKKVRWVLLAVVLVIVILAVALGLFIYNQFHDDVKELAQVDGDLAYMTDQAGNWDVVILHPDKITLDITQEGTAQDYLFNFTFDSSMVYFYSTRSGEFNPARVKADGSNLEVLNFITAGLKAISDKHLDVGPQWSPDGQQLAWTKTQVKGLGNFTNDICLAPVTDPNNFNCLTKDQSSNTEASWSPDGTRLVFASDRGENQDIWVVDIASGEQTRLTHDEGWAFQPVWSLDGEWILFIWNVESGTLEGGNLNLHVVKPDGSELHALADGEQFKGGAAYSPSGKQVAYMSNESGKWAIYVMNVDGSELRQVTDGQANALYPSWVPQLASEAAAQ